MKSPQNLETFPYFIQKYTELGNDYWCDSNENERKTVDIIYVLLRFQIIFDSIMPDASSQISVWRARLWCKTK